MIKQIFSCKFLSKLYKFLRLFVFTQKNTQNIAFFAIFTRYYAMFFLFICREYVTKLYFVICYIIKPGCVSCETFKLSKHFTIQYNYNYFKITFNIPCLIVSCETNDTIKLFVALFNHNHIKAILTQICYNCFRYDVV